MRDYLIMPSIGAISLRNEAPSKRPQPADSRQLTSSHKARVVKSESQRRRASPSLARRSPGILNFLALPGRSKFITRRRNGRIVRRTSSAARSGKLKSDVKPIANRDPDKKMDRHNIMYRTNVVPLGASMNVIRDHAEKAGTLKTAYSFWSVVNVCENGIPEVLSESVCMDSEGECVEITHAIDQLHLNPTKSPVELDLFDHPANALRDSFIQTNTKSEYRASLSSVKSTDTKKRDANYSRKLSDTQSESGVGISKLDSPRKNSEPQIIKCVKDVKKTKTSKLKVNSGSILNNVEFIRDRERALNDKLEKRLKHDKKHVNIDLNMTQLSMPGGKTPSPSPGKLSAKKCFFGQVSSPIKKRLLIPFGKWRGRKESSTATPTQTDIRIQQIDGGFFERFGSLFREYGSGPPIVGTKRSLLVDPTGETGDDSSQVSIDNRFSNEEVSGDVAESTGSQADSGVGGESLTDVDSEPEVDIDKSDFIGAAFGLNIDELYSEILFEILHNVGCDTKFEVGQTSLYNYVQDAFKMSNERHNTLLEAAEQKEAPEILLNVEVMDGKDLEPKDPNGLSDPFVTLYLQSVPTHRYNTSVKSATLNPVWEEHFSLPITDNASDDTLCLEVWDFDPAETVREKLGKFGEVRGVKGLRKLVKEIAIAASTGQHDNELVGRACVPLKTIPASGMTMWYSLDKKNKLRRQGVLRIRLAFSSQKQARVASQEHRHLLKILLLHELETSKVCAYWWCGNFSAQAEALLTQHAAQSGLNATEQALAQWSVYASVHIDHPLSFTLFSNLLDKLVRPLQTNSICDEEIKIFWEATKRLLPSVFSTIRKIRKKTAGDKNMLKQVQEVLGILSKLSLLEPPEKTDLFPTAMYPWLTYKDDEPNWDIRGTLGDAVTQGASDWFDHILEHNSCPNNTDDGKMQHMIKIIQLVRSDLQRALEIYDKIFQEVMNFHYAKTLYVLYEQKIAVLVEPEVVAICKSLKRLRFHETSSNNNDTISEPLAQGTTLFELYLVLQRFVVLGTGLSPGDSESFHVKDFHKWFHGGVAQWLDIAVYKALQRIEKAVELDTLVPVSPDVKYSSSAVDTLTIFYQIKVFWQQLNWPDVEGCYTFVGKIIDDICRCCVFYADKMAARVDGMGEVRDVFEKKFQVTNEWCLAINNIDYVRQSLQPFVGELNMEDILNKLSDLRSPLEADRCRHTLAAVIDNAVDTVQNKIIELLEIVANKMSPAMKRLLVEGAELHQQDNNSIDKVMRYLDDNLATLHAQLNAENFQRTLAVVWDTLSKILHDIVKTNLETRRPPSFFSNLHETLRLMIRSFKQSESDSSECDGLAKIEHLLAVNGMETAELIQIVHLERWREQQDLAPDATQFGQLTVRCQFQGCTLKIEVMNARNLIAMDTNGSCDSFVRIHFLPEEKFANVIKPKTQTHSRNQFPLYDETFTIIFTPEQKERKDALIMFSIKDKDYLGMSNQYMAEAFIHFKDIPDTPEPLSSLGQLHLPLTRPHKFDSESIKALQHRQGDKQAKEFLKKLRQKMGPPIPQ